MDEVRLDGRDMKPKPCSRCENIIQETVGGRGDEEVITWGEWAFDIHEERTDNAIGETDMGDTERRRIDRPHGPSKQPESSTG